MNIGYFNSIGNGWGKINNANNIERYNKLHNEHKITVSYKNNSMKKRYLTYLNKIEYFVSYQPKIADQINEIDGNTVNGIFKKCSSVTENENVLTINVIRIDTHIPFKFKINEENKYNWNYLSKHNKNGICFNGSIGSISSIKKSKYYKDIVFNIMMNILIN